MPAETLSISDAIVIDDLAKHIALQWQSWHTLRSNKITQWEEVRKYQYATDTTTTTNAQLPWKNKTTYPKLTQVADNLKANYLESLFPKRDWLVWEGYDKTSENKAKRDIIKQYMQSVIENSGFKKTVGALLDDWISFGNCFSTVEWADDRVMQPNGLQVGYVGPKLVRISPFDIVFNPIANDFEHTAKIIRKFVTLGDLKAELESLSHSDTDAQALWDYLKEIRQPGHALFGADLGPQDQFLQVDGFTSFQVYLGSDYAELLTFYGDLFVRETGEFYKNAVITIVDRHKLISNVPNPSLMGKPSIYHSSWRPRQDNLWGMGPLDNLVGMQYRIDHLENLKADVFDLNAFPPLKIKGVINDDFEWGPMERIYVGDDGDVNMVTPDFGILNANNDIAVLEARMEEVAGAPKEAMGIRSPGEKTKYEVQRLENAAGRIFTTRLNQFQEQQIEPDLIAMLEMSRRKLQTAELRMFDSDLQIADFLTITAQDLMGNGRIKPVAAEHFAEEADRVQNLTAFANSAVGQDPAVNVHISGLGLAKLFEELLEVQDYGLVKPFIRISEQHQAQSLQQASPTGQPIPPNAASGQPGGPATGVPGNAVAPGAAAGGQAPGLPTGGLPGPGEPIHGTPGFAGQKPQFNTLPPQHRAQAAQLQPTPLTSVT